MKDTSVEIYNKRNQRNTEPNYHKPTNTCKVKVAVSSFL